ncbi:hypothetical protein FD722_06665 [Photobacterium damselae subsp. damselae]|uniref:hypothetical protein n=1 Tax=Photobacterium damselae TaxID=38293 RepID=UPI0010FE6AEA|nr:hypothetical protein [Photobacterium damselae]TLS83836.1 hypothetical protein FD719_05130 [Photobacterium damselae subsp. damselae]TLS91028.1 hypothetical protein FD722_06665 [Photobacterium damselae subsp. damselae]
MKIETLLSKFDIKGINYGPSTGGGNPLLSAEEQLAVVGLCWHESPVGWLLLFVEGLRDVNALKQLQIATMGEALRLMEDWRGVYPEKAIKALCATAIAEATQQRGQICPECNGSAVVLSKCNHKRKCQCCKDGRIEWTQETRFAYFARTLPVTYSRFCSYQHILTKMVKWLLNNKLIAELSIKMRVEKEVNQ